VVPSEPDSSEPAVLVDPSDADVDARDDDADVAVMSVRRTAALRRAGGLRPSI